MIKLLDAVRNVIGTKRWKDSCILSFEIIGGLATLITIIGTSINNVWPLDGENWFGGILLRIFVVLLLYIGVSVIIWIVKGRKYSTEITIDVGPNKVLLTYGDIFEQDAWRVIPVDTHYDTRVDNKIISDESLHGKLVLYHGTKEGIETAVKDEAQRREYIPDEAGQYSFPLGTAISYKGTDGYYIMVALTKLNSDYVALTKMADYETALLNMWGEIERVYGAHDLAFPIMGNGVTHFTDGQDNTENLLRCMLCTLNSSRVHFKSNVTIIIYDGDKSKKPDDSNAKGKKRKSLSLYEFKDYLKMAR